MEWWMTRVGMMTEMSWEVDEEVKENADEYVTYFDFWTHTQF